MQIKSLPIHNTGKRTTRIEIEEEEEEEEEEGGIKI